MSRDKLWDSRPTIGLLSEVGASGSSYYTNLWRGFVSAALELDVNLICYVGGTINVSQYGFDAQRNILYDLVSGERVDGLLICGALGNFIAAEEFQRFVDCYRPLPMVGIAQTPGIPGVVVDNEKGVRDLVTHFIEVHGYRRLAFIRGPEGNLEAELRYRAYVEALAGHGLPLDPDLVAPGAFVHPTGVEAIRLLLDERQVKFDAVVAANDWMALGALEALGERGIRVPEDIALAGFDDTREAAASRPSLTTVRQPIHQLGRAGIEVLLNLLAGEQVPEQTILPTRLMVRQSCGCSEPAVAHAGLGPLERKTEPFKQAVVAQREAILSEMMQVVEVSAPSSSEWASRLLNAFVEEMVAGSAAGEPDAEPAPQAPFLSALDDVLRQAAAMSGPVDDWQEMISVIRRHLLPYLTDVATLSRAEDLFGQGRVMIGKMAQWKRACQEVEETQQAEVQGYLGGDLAAAVRTEQILDVLAHRLPQLGFSSFYLSFYDGQERPATWARLVLAHRGGERVEVDAGGRRFPTRRLLPDELFPQERRYTWVVESLNSRENQFGWIILEAGSRGGEIYGTLARQISGALQDSLLIQQLENRGVQLMTAAEVSRAASSVLDPDELIQQVVTLVRERFGLYYAGLFLVGDVPGAPGEWAVLRAGTGEAGQQMLERGHRLAVGGESMIGWCIANKQARIALDVGEEAVHFDNPLLPQTRSEMALPLLSRGQAIGALTIQSTEEAAFSQEDVAVLQIMADQLANAIVNVRQVEALAREQYLMSTLMDNMPASIYFKDRESRFIRLSRAMIDMFGLDDPSQAEGKTDFDFFGHEHAQAAYEDEQRIIETGQPMLNMEEKETWPDRPDTWVLTSKLPLRDKEGNIVGTFGISSNITPRKRAEEALARRARQERLVREIGDKMRRAVDMDALMQTTLREMAAALGSSSAFVQLSTPPAPSADERENQPGSRAAGGNGGKR
jgi:PAS domain S-box-containing protein